MFSAMRRRVRVSPASMIASLALVFAMTGGAYAAKKYLITSTKQISPSVLKALQGKAGPVGASGVNGVNGAQGPAGPAGAGGGKGETGPQGPRGAQGEKGVQGAQGVTGTTGFTETLPSGKTLKGGWAVAATLPGTGISEGSDDTAVSFGIPLGAAPEPVYVKAPPAEKEACTEPTKFECETKNKEIEKVEEEIAATKGTCPGTVEAPGAAKGHLCVFARAESNNSKVQVCSPATESLISCLFGGAVEADRTGFLVAALDHEKGLMALSGTWAVTAG